MFLSTTMFILFIGFFVYSWYVRIRFDKKWKALSCLAFSAVAASLTTIVLYWLIGYVMFLMSIAAAVLVLVAIIIGLTNVFLPHKGAK